MKKIDGNGLKLLALDLTVKNQLYEQDVEEQLALSSRLLLVSDIMFHMIILHFLTVRS